MSQKKDRRRLGEQKVPCRQKQEVDRAAAEAERQEDDRMLAAALQAAAEAEAREAAAKAAVREQELRFRKHLEAAMQHEAQVGCGQACSLLHNTPDAPKSFGTILVFIEQKVSHCFSK